MYGGEVERVFTGELWGSAQIEIANRVEVIDAPGLSTRPGRIHYGANSGFQAVNLAFLWGAAQIILLAFDMTHGPHGETHYFGRHAGGLPNPPRDLSGWVQLIAQLGADLRAQGVEVVNASRRTAITCFERQPIEEARESVKDAPPLDADLHEVETDLRLTPLERGMLHDDVGNSDRSPIRQPGKYWHRGIGDVLYKLLPSPFLLRRVHTEAESATATPSRSIRFSSANHVP